MTILATILTAVLTLSAASVDVETLDGARYDGQLRNLSVENARIQTDAGEKTVPTDRLMSVTFSQNAQASPRRGTLLITLVDGSEIMAKRYEVQDEQAQIFLTEESTPTNIPTRDISSVRFANESNNLNDPTLNDAWEKLQKDPTHSDRLVVAKGDSLDYHAGTLGDVTDSRILFSLDGDPLKVKRQKVFGITYYHPAGRELPKPHGRLLTTSGSCWTFVSVTLEDDHFNLETPTGLELSLAVEKVQKINFAVGKIAYLSDMQPESIAWTPYLTMQNSTDSNDPKARAALFGPKFNKSFQSGPLVLDGEHYPKGLAIHSRSVITYRLNKKYGRLTAMAGIADRVRPRGHVQLIIEADGNVLLDREISGTEEAVPLDLNLTQADRLTITVDFGKQADIADRLILGDAKVME